MLILIYGGAFMRIGSERKGMTMAIGVIIAIVVLIVVALAVIAISSGSLNKFFSGTSGTTGNTGGKIDGTVACNTCAFTWTKNTASTFDDQVVSLPFYCQTAAKADYCCSDMSRQQCKSLSTCGAQDTGSTITWTACTQA